LEDVDVTFVLIPSQRLLAGRQYNGIESASG
jgi:hypothetical protein